MWAESKFSSGTGNMDKALFDTFAKTYGVDQAVWIAKYFGVALNTVKAWVAEYLN